MAIPERSYRDRVSSDPTGAALVRAVARRQEEIAERLAEADGDLLTQESRLPGWDRLTIACHLRYGADASRRMTTDTLAGNETSFYPQGREHQRPSTLCPSNDESTSDVIAALNEESQHLVETWHGVDERQWKTKIQEPADNPDLGSINLWTLALLRLTEVEVHGHDLDLGLSRWSETFVSTALPMRLLWLPSRRSNRRDTERLVDGTWAIAAVDGPTFVVNASGTDVEVAESSTGVDADATIVGTADRLLAFILGRGSLGDLEVRGDPALARLFLDAFPAP